LSVRLPFTKNEIARYLYLGEYLSKGLEEFLPTVKPGMTEMEIAGGISNALWKYNVKQVMHLVSVDERADKYRHALSTDKKLRHNLLVSAGTRGLLPPLPEWCTLVSQSRALLSSTMIAATWKPLPCQKPCPVQTNWNSMKPYAGHN
jgi:hypothetical protein